MNYEIIEVIDPPADAMVRKFHCYVCNKDHLQKGKIVILWVKFQDGYRTQAAEVCVNDETNS